MLEALKRPSMMLLAGCTLATWFVGLLSTASWAIWAMGACWIVFGGYILWRLVAAGHRRLAMIPVVFVIVIAVGVSLPTDTFNAAVQPLNEFLDKVNSPLPAGKVGHIICFAFLTLFVLKVRKRLAIGPIDVAMFLILLAVATEGFQLLIPGRTTKFVDLGYDFLGALIGLSVFGIYKLVSNRSHDSEESELA